MSYKEQLSAKMQETLQAAGYTNPTPIQEQSLEALLSGRDMIGIAQTGTGKTAAFGVPIIERVWAENKKTQALVLCPTRELALQTTEVLRKLSAHNRLRVVSIYGGQNANVQINALRNGAQIVVGTPGRVKDLIERRVLKLANVRHMVLDEADEMLDFGFLPDIRSIISCVTGEHQTLLFSATFNKDISKVASQFLSDPLRVEVGERNEPVETVRQMCIKTEEGTKLNTVQYLLKETAPRLALIFCNTRRRVKALTKKLSDTGVSAACLHGDLSQNQRDTIMRGFRKGSTPVLIATDVAARGIDVDMIDLVINYDVPDKPEYYVHRIGRTGRAGHDGLACTLVSPNDKSRLRDIRLRYHVLAN